MPEAIRIPNNWGPRAYQMNVWRYLEGGGKRAICIWHRRAGKDDVCLHWAASSMIDKPATYWHMLPAYSQGRKAIWTAVNPHTGKRRIDEAFPHELRANTNEQEMFIRLKNGATWQVLGSDRYDAAVGSPPYGITFSEWALSNPASWAYLAPIVIENGGWALFITTARGPLGLKPAPGDTEPKARPNGGREDVSAFGDTALHPIVANALAEISGEGRAAPATIENTFEVLDIGLRAVFAGDDETHSHIVKLRDQVSELKGALIEARHEVRELKLIQEYAGPRWRSHW
jgi:hypothetical protein